VGFWKCHDRLRAQGYGWNHKRTWRVYCHLRLNLATRVTIFLAQMIDLYGRPAAIRCDKGQN
jgi:hypothetical protein